VLVDRFQQADAGVAEKGAKLGIDLEFAAQVIGSLGLLSAPARQRAPPLLDLDLAGDQLQFEEGIGELLLLGQHLIGDWL
jgi:hypothetical protein